jgi:hypothetical protein
MVLKRGGIMEKKMRIAINTGGGDAPGLTTGEIRDFSLHWIEDHRPDAKHGLFHKVLPQIYLIRWK